VVSALVFPLAFVGVADQINATLYLGRRRTEQGRIRGCLAGRGRRSEGRGRAGPAEIRVRVVDAGVNDRDLDVLAAKGRRALPDLGCADERHAHHVLYAVRGHGNDLNYTRKIGEAGDLTCERSPP